MRDTGDYRGKRIDNDEMVEGEKLTSNGKTYIVVECETSNQYGDGTDLYATEWYEVDPKTVGQYTGLQDKNGKDIYEGDMLKYTANERTGTRVSYKRRGYDTYPVNSDIEITGVVNKGEHDGLLTYIVETEQYTTYESYFWGSGKRSDRPDLVKNNLTKPLSTKREYEVVGNRWDNPDLLGG